MQRRAEAAVTGLSENCKREIEGIMRPGQTLAGLQTKAGSLSYRDARQSYIARDPMRLYGFDEDGTVGAYLNRSGVPGSQRLAFVTGSTGNNSNSVVLGSAFFAATARTQDLTFVHEALHSYLGMDDIDLSNALRVGSGVTQEYSSLAINDFFLNYDCDRERYNARGPR